MSDLPCLTCGDSECGFAGTTIIRDDCKFSCYVPKGEDSMSDCSTEAMKTKAKTCGNCGHSVVCSAQNKGDDWDYCNQWIPESTDTLEQRYQQLEQVAREMLGLIKGIEREYPRLLDPNTQPGGQIVYPMPSESFREQLEALGVSLDG